MCFSFQLLTTYFIFSFLCSDWAYFLNNFLLVPTRMESSKRRHMSVYLQLISLNFQWNQIMKCVCGNTLEIKGLQLAVDRLVIVSAVYRTVRAVC